MKNRVLFLTAACHCVNHMFFESLGPLLPFLISVLALSHSQAGRLGFVYSLIYGLSNYPSGHWCDRYGRRYFILLFLLIASSATLLMAFSHSYLWLIILCGVAGFGGGLYHPPGTALVTDYFEKHERGTALGFHASGGSLGILLAFVVVGGIASRWNWQMAVAALAGIGFALALSFRLFAWDVGENTPSANGKGTDTPGNEVGFWELMRWLPYMLVLYGIVMFVWKGAYTWIPTYLKETYHLTSGKAVVFSVILPIIGIFSNYLTGKFSDNYGRKITLFIVFSVLAVCFFLLFLGKRSMLFPLLFLLGYFINAFSGIINAYTADQLPPQVLGKAYGIMFTFSICVSALAPYVMGVISDHTSLAMSMLFLSGVSVMGLLTALINPKKFVIR